MNQTSVQATRVKPQGFQLQAADLSHAWTQFILSRQAMRCSPATMDFYAWTAGVFLTWLQAQGVSSPDQVSAGQVRTYLAELNGRGKADTTLNAHARAIRTLTRFWHAEGYLPARITFEMPRLAKKRLLVLSADELVRLIAACKGPREKALIMLLADSGLRRAEVSALNCGDVDIRSGRIQVEHGKGDKARTAVICATTRRALLAYRRDIESPVSENMALFVGRSGERLSGAGIMQVLRRLSRTTGIRVTPHALRRTFVVLALRDGMDSLHVQALLGHSSLDMVQRYAQMVDDDLLLAHSRHSPIERLPKLTAVRPGRTVQ